MHILAAASGRIDDGSEAVDLEQTPADVIILSAADSELAAIADAVDTVAPTYSLRLANWSALTHPLSVDLYLERTAAQAKLIIIRLLGGASYWTYGLEQLEYHCRQNGCALVVLPGDARPDPTLMDRSTVSTELSDVLFSYFQGQGTANMAALLKSIDTALAGGSTFGAATTQPKAGIYETNRKDPSKAPDTATSTVPIIFYRALIEGGNTAPIEQLSQALRTRNLLPVPIFVTSLKDPECASIVRRMMTGPNVGVILNGTGFSLSNGADPVEDPLREMGVPVLQVVFAGSTEQSWLDGGTGLSARDLAMSVVLPELDGRILSRAVSFKDNQHYHPKTQCYLSRYVPVRDRVDFVAELASRWSQLGVRCNEDKKIALVIANYPNRDGRIGNGVGYDTPASTVKILHLLLAAGYRVADVPATGTALVEELQSGQTNSAAGGLSPVECRLTLADYHRLFTRLPQAVCQAVMARWGSPADDPFVTDGEFHLPGRLYGRQLVAIQPARGYNIDPVDSYHDPDLVPPHGYFAFYLWLRHVYQADAVIHNGKHGNLEWLPGKSLALSADCFPDAALGPLPVVYPFIVNDPGEGTQAKRRTSAVIVDHLTPPLARAESYGPLRDLEVLVDEYYQASGMDNRRLKLLAKQILDLARKEHLLADARIAKEADEHTSLQQLDAYLCELKEAQIRDGLHILGEAPIGRQLAGLLVALTRLDRAQGSDGDCSLVRALAADFGFVDFDPLSTDFASPWTQEKPAGLHRRSEDPWRTVADTIERLELYAEALIDGRINLPEGFDRTAAVLTTIEQFVRPAIEQSAEQEAAAIIALLGGRSIAPGPSGAPTRGRLDVLPTGRNFFSIDNRTLPTPTAWTLGQKSAELLLRRHFQDNGSHLRTVGLSVWGTSNMRTGGDDLAQALALIGARPKWDPASWRVTGFEIIPIVQLGRPRVDVTLRISGFFRDAFPHQIDLFDSAVRAIGALADERDTDNPIAVTMRAEAQISIAEGLPSADAHHLAGFRIYGSKPGAYGAGLQAIIDEELWQSRDDIAAAYVEWGSYAYGKGADGARAEGEFKTRLSLLEAVLHNQDNREHDILDSDDYYQFEGGMAAAVETHSGVAPTIYHGDHSRPERPMIRTLDEEISRVVRSRAVNPKWLAGVMRHGYKGASEIAATVDYLFAFAATTNSVQQHHFQLVFDAYVDSDQVQQFMIEHNPHAYDEMCHKLADALDRGLWRAQSNSVRARLADYNAIGGE